MANSEKGLEANNNVGYEMKESDIKQDEPNLTNKGEKAEFVGVKEPFRKSRGFKALISVVAIVGVAVIVVPTSVCLTGHCGESCSKDCTDPWSYNGKTGPSCWSTCHGACGGSSQSPINLDSTIAIAVSADGIPVLSGYDINQSISLFNNGHTVQGALSQAPNVTGLGLPGQYIGEQFHFHWGQTSLTGSEHTLDGVHYPMEVHIVHYSANYSNFGAAAAQNEGLAVFGFFFQVTTDDNSALDSLIQALQEVKYKGNGTDLDMPVDALFPVDSLVNETFTNYYRYPGSLTTPPCHESVVWTVFTNPVEISETQLDAFRQTFHGGPGSHHLYDNYRPVVPLGQRQLYSFSP